MKGVVEPGKLKFLLEICVNNVRAMKHVTKNKVVQVKSSTVLYQIEKSVSERQ